MKSALLLAVLLLTHIVETGVAEEQFAPPLSQLVPLDKKLDPAWVESLTARGEPTVLRGKELDWVGMPVSGQFTGHVYVGGDGTLWLWDIFNRHRFTTDKNGNHYEKPEKPEQPFRQGFALRIGKTIRTLNRAGFADIAFRGEYPIGHIDYRDAAVPLTVHLEVFSPFIPLDSRDSGIPGIILRYRLTNPGSSPVTATVVGSFDNPVLLNSAAELPTAKLRNQAINGPGYAGVLCSADVGRPTTPNAKPLPDDGTFALVLLAAQPDQAAGEVSGPVTNALPATVERTVTVNPGKSADVSFAFTWHFPNLTHLPNIPAQGRFYDQRFHSATDVAAYLGQKGERLTESTRRWRDTWYDSTLPYWFLDRTFLNIDNLATSSCFRLRDGRMWCWEGIGNCAGTCGHVYFYGQAVGRLFPDLERDQREKVDFKTSMKPDGAIRFRGENNDGPAIDAQAGYILRALREHQMCTNDAFLRRIWPAVKKATEWLIAQDGNGDGILEGAQHNTLDTDWYGAVAWLSGLYQASLQASAVMADDLGDAAFATTCRTIAATGRNKLVSELFNGDYFQNRVDPKHPDTVNSGSGCHIDQVIGQSWAFQVGLPRIFPEAETKSALRALWLHNFTPDVGPYRAVNTPGRWYAMPGEAGLLMCTFPKPDWDLTKATGAGNSAWAAMYFNECMNGFEHQVAGHMIWEGMVKEGLAIERVIHDRYGAAKRNPYNEVECGDHYGRSMASYGVFIAACGFTYDGPKGAIGFSPAITPDHFKAAFTSAEGWGSFSQERSERSLKARIALTYGHLSLTRWSVVPTTGHRPVQVMVTLDGRSIPATLETSEPVHGNASRFTIVLGSRTDLTANSLLSVVVR